MLFTGLATIYWYLPERSLYTKTSIFATVTQEIPPDLLVYKSTELWLQFHMAIFNYIFYSYCLSS